MNRRPSFLEELRDPITGRIIPLKSNLPSPPGGGGAMVVSAPEVEGPTVLSSILEHRWSPERPDESDGPQFSPPGSPGGEKTPAERIRPKDSPSLQREPPHQPQPCLEGNFLRRAMGLEDHLEEPPRIQRRLNLKEGLQSFPPPEEDEETDEEMPPASKRHRQ